MKTRVKVDNDGRILIPVKVRKSIGIEPGDRLSVQVTEGGILEVEPEAEKCSLCKGTEELKKIDGINFCRKCIQTKLIKLIEEEKE